MPTFALKPQADGTFSNVQVIVGALSIHEALDDSADTTNDGDASYVQVTTTGGASSRVSLKFFLQAEDFVIDSITLQIAMRKSGVGASAGVFLGFYQGGVFGSDGIAVSTGTTSYVLKTKTYTTNPATGLPWAASDLPLCEPAFEGDPASSALPRISLFNIPTLVCHAQTNWQPPNPRVAYA